MIVCVCGVSSRLEEFKPQCAAMRRGLATVVPYAVLSLFTWEELGKLTSHCLPSSLLNDTVVSSILPLSGLCRASGVRAARDGRGAAQDSDPVRGQLGQ